MQCAWPNAVQFARIINSNKILIKFKCLSCCLLRRWFSGSAQCASISSSGSFLSMCICETKKKYCVSLARLDLNRRLRLTWLGSAWLGLAWLYAILNCAFDALEWMKNWIILLKHATMQNNSNHKTYTMHSICIALIWNIVIFRAYCCCCPLCCGVVHFSRLLWEWIILCFFLSLRLLTPFRQLLLLLLLLLLLWLFHFAIATYYTSVYECRT